MAFKSKKKLAVQQKWHIRTAMKISKEILRAHKIQIMFPQICIQA
jgi:hypothetical protein